MRGVVILYSGRWYIGQMTAWVESHFENLIAPFDADVVVTVSASQLHCGNQSEFDFDVKRAFRRRLKAYQFFDRDTPFKFVNPDPLRLTPYKWSMLKGWFYQYNNVANALRLAGSSYSTYIRTRIDTTFAARVPMLLPSATEIVAIENLNIKGKFSPQYRDWFYVGDFKAMHAIVDTSFFHYNYSKRCFELCSEEQVEYHVINRNFSFVVAQTVPPLTLHRMKCNITLFPHENAYTPLRGLISA